jgi:16S rRNA (uracil1498-N3)-methyltransferase
MSNLRFYSPEKLHVGDNVKLSNNAAVHATKVMRLDVADTLILFDGDGFDYTCELVGIKKNEVIAYVDASVKVNNESSLYITLLQGISSGDRMDYTIQKAVELGVAAIQPISTERSMVKLSAERAEKRLEHWQNVVIAACEQSGRAKVPKVAKPVNLTTWLAANNNESYDDEDASHLRILLNPIGAKQLSALPKTTHNIQLLIGAEGGLSQAEIELATQHGFQSIVLGPRILRTETAALTAIAALQTVLGDF